MFPGSLLFGLRMNLLFRVRRWLARLMLRGPVMDGWLRRRGRQVDSCFRARLVDELEAPCKSKPLPRFTERARIRQILLIADCLWEQRDLLPELARIAETRLLNLRSSLKAMQESPEGRAEVVEAVRRFTEANSARSRMSSCFTYGRDCSPTRFSRYCGDVGNALCSA